MSTVQVQNTIGTVGQNYAARIQNVLKQTTQAARSFSFPTVSSGGEGTLLAKLTPYIIYGLVAVFIVLLVLVIVHYTITPIFNFGDQPSALITVQASDWTKMWQKDSESAAGAVGPVLPQQDYTIVLDVKVLNQQPSTTIGNKFVFFYKTVPPIAQPTLGQYREAQAGRIFYNTASIALSNFGFLSNSQMPVNEYPNMIGVYDALSSKIIIYIKVKSEVNEAPQFDLIPLSTTIVANTPYRLGLVVSEKMAELYINGKYASTALFQGKVVVGTNDDRLYGTPNQFQNAVVIKNLFTTNRVVPVGTIRTLGGPALK